MTLKEIFLKTTIIFEIMSGLWWKNHPVLVHYLFKNFICHELKRILFGITIENVKIVIIIQCTLYAPQNYEFCFI